MANACISAAGHSAVDSDARPMAKGRRVCNRDQGQGARTAWAAGVNGGGRVEQKNRWPTG